MLARGYEGLVSKDAPSPYAGLTLKWLKVKQLHYRWWAGLVDQRKRSGRAGESSDCRALPCALG